MCIPIEPFARCFAVLFRVCCPYFYKKRAQKLADEEEDRRLSSETETPRPSRKSLGEHGQYSTIGQLTNATVITEPPPPVFAKFVLRKSVDRLNSEVRSIDFDNRWKILFAFA